MWLKYYEAMLEEMTVNSSLRRLGARLAVVCCC